VLPKVIVLRNLSVMSCQIKGIANVSDVVSVKKLLYGDDVSKCEFFFIDTLIYVRYTRSRLPIRFFSRIYSER